MRPEPKFKVGQLVTADSYGDVIIHSMVWKELYSRWGYSVRYPYKETPEVYPVFDHRMKLSEDVTSYNHLIVQRIEGEITKTKEALAALEDAVKLLRI